MYYQKTCGCVSYKNISTNDCPQCKSPTVAYLEISGFSGVKPEDLTGRIEMYEEIAAKAKAGVAYAQRSARMGFPENVGNPISTAEGGRIDQEKLDHAMKSLSALRNAR